MQSYGVELVSIMAYCIKPDETVADGLRRVAKKELRSARDELSRAHPPDERAIHEARKHIKKLRAVMELMDADGGRGLRISRKRLRAINRELSRLRDADAMLYVLGVLKKKYPALFTEHGYARARRRLAVRKHDVMQRANVRGTWNDLERDLKKLRRSVRRWQSDHQRLGVLEMGIRATYRRGRQALAQARKHQRADDFHEWRKQIKALWYQLRLVQESAPALRRDAERLHRAAEDGDVDAVGALIAEGVPLNEFDDIRYTPLHYAGRAIDGRS